jgi:hypothetical protein
MLTRYTPIVATAILVATTLIGHGDQTSPSAAPRCIPQSLGGCLYKVSERFNSGVDPDGMPFMILTAAGPLGTPDGASEIVGRVENLTLKLAREFDTNNNLFTHIYLSYDFNNYPGTESDKKDANQRLDINLLDGNGNPVVKGLTSGGSPIPRDECHYNDIYVPGNIALPYGRDKSSFDFTGKDIQSIEVTITGFGVYQGRC